MAIFWVILCFLSFIWEGFFQQSKVGVNSQNVQKGTLYTWMRRKACDKALVPDNLG